MNSSGRTLTLTLTYVFLLMALPACGQQDESVNILFLSKSSGYEHRVIAQKDGQPSHVDNVLNELSRMYDGQVTATKDASLINAENLKNYDLVVFYTTGDLTKPGADKNPPMSSTGLAELIEWITQGGAFIGMHSASDTFHSKAAEGASTYIEMLGGEFLRHGLQFEGTVKIVDPGHPAVADVPKEFTLKDEWYMFKNFNKEKIHVLAVLDPGDAGRRQDMYKVDPYPIVWCRALGEGRVYYNAMGHREDVWENPTFQQVMVNAAQWVLKQGPLDAEPNYDEVVGGSK